jgi:hypothetical protein
MYTVWRAALKDEWATDRLSIENVRAMRGISLLHGESVRARWPELRIRVEAEGTPADHARVGVLSLASDRLKSLFEAEGVHAEYLPLIMTGLDVGRFWAVNVLDVVDCIDRDRSRYTTIDGRTEDIERLVINEVAIGHRPLVRVGETWANLVLASPRIVARVTEEGLTGMNFVDPEEREW